MFDLKTETESISEILCLYVKTGWCFRLNEDMRMMEYVETYYLY
jgi:hypothetical protein